MKRVIICGSRDWTDQVTIGTFILGLRAMHPNLTVVHGNARGADKLAQQFCLASGIPEEPHPADWVGHGKGAGPIRNREMLESGAFLVVAFKDGFDRTLQRGGTENMIRIATEAGVRTVVVSH